MKHSIRAKRVSNRAVRRQADVAIREGANVFMALLAVLAQKGGEVVVTKGTAQQVAANIRNLSYVLEAGETEAEFKVRLLEASTIPQGGLPDASDVLDASKS